MRASDRKPTGVAVNIGARVASLAHPGEVLVTRTVRNLVAGSGLQFVDRGMHRLKGVPGDWELFTVSADTAATNPADGAAVHARTIDSQGTRAA